MRFLILLSVLTLALHLVGCGGGAGPDLGQPDGLDDLPAEGGDDTGAGDGGGVPPLPSIPDPGGVGPPPPPTF